jgi:hypothetical protein
MAKVESALTTIPNVVNAGSANTGFATRINPSVQRNVIDA